MLCLAEIWKLYLNILIKIFAEIFDKHSFLFYRKYNL